MQPPNPPAPLFAEFIGIGPTYRVHFDQDLLPGVTGFANYDVTHSDNDKIPNGATILGNVVSITGVADVTFTPPNGISYHATPPELFGLTGEPVAPFVKVPFI